MGPHWAPPSFTEWPGYARLWGQAITWLAGNIVTVKVDGVRVVRNGIDIFLHRHYAYIQNPKAGASPVLAQHVLYYR